MARGRPCRAFDLYETDDQCRMSLIEVVGGPKPRDQARSYVYL